MEKVHGIIQEARLHKIVNLFNRKPGELKFNDTDALVITVKNRDGNKIIHTFYFCLKPDGTFDQQSISRGSRARNRSLASFLMYYGITEDVGKYNLKEKLSEFEGRHVELLLSGKDEMLYIP